MRRALVVVAVVIALAGSLWLWQRGRAPAPPAPAAVAPRSAYARAVDDRFASLREEALFRTKFAGLPEPEARRAVIDSAERGFSRLGDDALVARARLLARMFEEADVASCAAAVRGTATREQSDRLAAALDPKSAAEWADLVFASARAELTRQPEPPLAPPEVQMALAQLLGHLPPDDADRLKAGMPHVTELPDADACWVGRTLYGRVAALEKPHSAVLARMLARK